MCKNYLACCGAGRCDKMGTVREFAYLGDRSSTGGGCEADMTARTRCGWVKSRKCVKLMYGKKITLRLKRTIFMGYASPGFLCVTEVWCLSEDKLEFL